MTPEQARKSFGEGFPNGKATLHCPFCEGTYLHGYGAEADNSGTDGHPSYGIKFWCEYCHARFTLWFVNHKGMTEITAERKWDEELREHHRQSEGFDDPAPGFPPPRTSGEK